MKHNIKICKTMIPSDIIFSFLLSGKKTEEKWGGEATLIQEGTQTLAM